MINRSFVAAVVASAALLTASVTLGGSTAQAARARKPAIGKASLSPTRLTGRGGTVQIRVKINPNGQTISSVTATSTMSGASPSAASALQAAGGDYYTGSVRIGANPRTRKNVANVFVQVDTPNGVVKKRVGKVQLDAGGGPADDSTPPPPPNI